MSLTKILVIFASMKTSMINDNDTSESSLRRALSSSYQTWLTGKNAVPVRLNQVGQDDVPGDYNKHDPERENWPCRALIHKKKKLLEKLLETVFYSETCPNLKISRKNSRVYWEKAAFLVLRFQSWFTRTKNDAFSRSFSRNFSISFYERAP